MDLLILSNLISHLYKTYVNHKEMAVILGKVGCLVYPSTCDTFSLVVIEALASGLYVIASSYLRGIFDEFQAIGVLEYCNPTSSEMSKRMKAFLTREIDIYAFEKARQLIMEKYSWNSISGLLYDYFISFVKMGDQVAKN